MSRVGNAPIAIPNNVEVTIDGQHVEVKGPKGTRSFTATDDVDLVLDGTTVTVKPRGLSKRARQQWGMSRSMVANLVTGPGATVGSEMTTNEDVDLVSFTGGLVTGRHLMANAAATCR